MEYLQHYYNIPPVIKDILRELVISQRFDLVKIGDNLLDKLKDATITIQKLYDDHSTYVVNKYTGTIDNDILPGHLSTTRASFDFIKVLSKGKLFNDIENLSTIDDELSNALSSSDYDSISVIFTKLNELLDSNLEHIKIINKALYNAKLLDSEYGYLLSKVIKLLSLDQKQWNKTVQYYEGMKQINNSILIESGYDFILKFNLRNKPFNLFEIKRDLLTYTNYINRSKALREILQ